MSERYAKGQGFEISKGTIKTGKRCIRSLGNMEEENRQKDSAQQHAMKSCFIHTAISSYPCIISIHQGVAIHHHQSLLPSVGHRDATMSLFHRFLSFAIACASPHNKPISLSSVSTVFLQVVLGLPLFLLPAGVHLNATLGILSGDIRNTCSSHLNRRFLISKSIP